MIKIKKWYAGRNRSSRDLIFFSESQLDNYLLADFPAFFVIKPSSRKRIRYSRFDDFLRYLSFGGEIEKHPFYR